MFKLFRKFDGVMDSPPDYRDFPPSRAYGGVEVISIPQVWETWQPPVENQGKTGNCVAQSLANIMECIDHREGLSHNDRSVGYIYGMSTVPDYSGMYPRDACAALVKEGDVYRSTWEYLQENPECYKLRQALPEEITSQAKKVKMYVRIQTEEEAKLFMLKYNLPILVTVEVSEVWNIMWGTGRHAMVLFGWDDTKKKKTWNGKYTGNNLHLMNSWGTGGVLGDGTKWVNFENFKEVWGIVPLDRVIIDDEIEKIPVQNNAEENIIPVIPEMKNNEASDNKEESKLTNASLDKKIKFSDIIRMKNIVPTSRCTLKEVMNIVPDADIIINTALFDTLTGNIISRVVAEGMQHGGSASWTQTWGIAFGDEKGPRISWDNGVKAPEYIGPYSSMIYNGEIGDGLSGSNAVDKRGRTAIGLTEDSLVVLCIPDDCSDKMNSTTLCNYMKERGCSFAINLDGGGSSQYKDGDRKYSSGRKCPAWLAIWLKKDIEVEPENKQEETKKEDKKEENVEPDVSGIKCVCKAKTYTLDSSGQKEGNRYIDAGDKCVLNSITKNCLIEITYPTSKGDRTAYIKSLEAFTPIV